MGIRWSDIPDEAPVATQGVRWSDIPDAPQQGVRWSDITETVEPEPEGRLTKLVRESIEGPRQDAAMSEAFRVEQMKDPITSNQFEQMKLDIDREERLENKARIAEKRRPFQAWAAGWRGNMEKAFRSTVGLGMKVHEGIADITGNEEVERIAGDYEKMFARETEDEVFSRQERDRQTLDFIRKGETGKAAAYAVGNATSDTVQALLMLSVLPKVHAIPGMATKAGMGFKAAAGATAANAGRIATWNFLTSPGSVGKRFNGAAQTFMYMMTPALSGPLAGKLFGTSGLGANVFARGLDFFTNTGISTLVVQQYPEAYAEAKQMAIEAGDTQPGAWMSHILRTGAVGTMISDLIGSLGTKPTDISRASGTPGVDRQTEAVNGIMRQWDQESQVRDATATQFVEPSAGTIPLLGQRPASESPQAYRNVLNKQIRETVAERGISKKDLAFIKKHTKDSPEATLRLAQRWRPKMINGVQPIDERTEKKLESAMGVLGATDKLGREQIAKILLRENIKGPPTYKDKDNYMTETDAKKLLGILHSEAEIYAGRIAMEKAMPDDVRQERDQRREETQRSATAQAETGKEIKISSLWVEDMMWNEMERLTGDDFHTSYVDASDARLDALGRVKRTMNRLHETAGFDMSTKSPTSQERIRNLVRGNNVPEATVGERDQAREVRNMLDGYKGLVQESRFLDMYDDYKGDVKNMFDSQYKDAKTPPDMSMKDMKEAVDAYEYEGIDALRALIAKPETTWGVIDNNYSPDNALRSPDLERKGPGMKSLSDGHLKTKRGIEFDETGDRTYFSQLEGYFKQIEMHSALRPHLAHISRVWDRNSGKFDNWKKHEKRMTASLNGMKGYSQLEGSDGVRKAMSYVYSANFFDPRKWFRNYLQPWALYPWRRDFLNPRNQKMALPEASMDNFLDRVDQGFGITKHQMYGDAGKEGKFVTRTGLRGAKELANRWSQYPKSDFVGRLKTYKAAHNRVLIALEDNPNDIKAATRAMRLDFLEDNEQARAFEELAKGGPLAMAQYFGGKVADRVHFIYDRSRRASVEQKGSHFWNLFTFPRSYAERLLLQGRKVLNYKRGSHKAKMKAATDIAGVLAIGSMIGRGYMELTGATVNPYAPMNVLPWTPGGLTMGMANDWGDTVWNINQALQGDERALDRALVGIAGVGRSSVPLLKIVLNSIEAGTDMRAIDVMLLRQMREAVDERYELDPDVHEMEREFIDAIRHGAFGTEPGKKREE